jgi:hypothetical protein
MVRRANAYDPLEATTAPRWHVVRTMHGSVVESHQLAPDADLKHFFIETMLKWIDAGWKIGEFTSTSGTFFCTRGNERRMVTITPSDPTEEPHSMYRSAFPGNCPTCGDS